MAAGEYVSVRSQAETERADLNTEKRELTENPALELEELAGIYRLRGLSNELALRVAAELTAKNAIDAHARDELGITEALKARPFQAAAVSATTFVAGSALPLTSSFFSASNQIQWVTIGVTMISLLLSGGIAAKLGGASVVRGALRVAFWGAIAMAATTLVGRLFQVQLQ